MVKHSTGGQYDTMQFTDVYNIIILSMNNHGEHKHACMHSTLKKWPFHHSELVD